MLISRSDRGVAANWWFTVDKALLGAVLLLMACGVLISMAASPPVAERIGLNSFHFFKSQLQFLVIAVPILLATSLLDVKAVRRVSFAVLAGAMVLMVLAMFFGPEIKGAHRWLNIGPFNIQPSELGKPALVVVVAFFLGEQTRKPDMPGLIVALLFIAAFVGLLVIQPDFGQTALVVLTCAAILLVWGISWYVVFGLGALGAAGVVAAYSLVPHVRSRIDRFLNPEGGDTFQVDAATEAFRNGGFFGMGPGAGEAKLRLPDAHTDFCFAVVAEELGMIACLALICLFGFVVLRILVRAKSEPDPFKALALAGLGILFGLQAFINMGVNVALLPAKGMTLPFISYGGSSLLGTTFAMGLVLALGRRRPVHRASGFEAGHDPRMALA